MSMTLTDNRIHFPIAQSLAGIHNSRPLVDTHPVFELPTPVVASVALPTPFLTAQMTMEFSSGPFIGENVLVDPFVTDLKTAVFVEPARHLLRAPLLADQGFDYSPDGCIDSISGPYASVQGKLMSLLGSISFQSAISSEFSADCRLMNADQARYFGLIVSCFQKCINLVSLLLGKLRVGSHQCSFDLVGLRSIDATAAYLLVQPSKLHFGVESSLIDMHDLKSKASCQSM